jgi:hypothetical protein
LTLFGILSLRNNLTNAANGRHLEVPNEQIINKRRCQPGSIPAGNNTNVGYRSALPEDEERSSEAAMGRERGYCSAQFCVLLRVNEPKKTGARSARKSSAAKIH